MPYDNTRAEDFALLEPFTVTTTLLVLDSQVEIYFGGSQSLSTALVQQNRRLVNIKMPVYILIHQFVCFLWLSHSKKRLLKYYLE